jgi:Fe-S-cluster containining protein
VPITHRDLQRLSRAAARPIESFVEWLAPDEIDMSGEPETFLELDVGRRLLLLRHEDGACHLLTSEGRCSEYAARPSACAAYPYALSDETSDAQPRRLFILEDSPCGDESCAGGQGAERAVQSVEAELSEYVTLVGQWNRRQKRRRLAGHRPQAVGTFLEFLAAALRR